MSQTARTNGREAGATPTPPNLSRIVQVFPSLILRMYCRIRLLIIGPRFLKVIARHLPERGDVLEIGCGFGLTGLYLSELRSDLVIRGYDLDQKRVATASAAAQALGRTNVHFAFGDAAQLTLDRRFAAAYAIDLIHHVPREQVPAFLSLVYDRLQPCGRFVIKDVDNTPAYKRFVSWLTDRVMVGMDEPIYYWPVAELTAALEQVGFTVQSFPMPDILPYPHVLYVCEKQGPRP
jgi:cyclopropane fatty-acyl-phospholipid synthase-like methyltransferase